MDDEILRTFELHGVPRTETKVYLDLMKNGESSATEIAQRTKLHRANVYDTIAKLKEKNLVYPMIKEEKKLFIALPPESLLQKQKEKFNDLKNTLSYLKKTYKEKGNSPQIYVLEGLDELKSLLFGLIDEKKLIWMFGFAEKEDLVNMGEKYIHMFHSHRIEERIPLKWLFYDYPIEKVKQFNKMKYTQARLLLPAYRPKSSHISKVVCGNKVCVTIWLHPIYTLVIESGPIAKEYTDGFALLWNCCEKI